MDFALRYNICLGDLQDAILTVNLRHRTQHSLDVGPVPVDATAEGTAMEGMVGTVDEVRHVARRVFFGNGLDLVIADQTPGEDLIPNFKMEFADKLGELFLEVGANDEDNGDIGGTGGERSIPGEEDSPLRMGPVK